MISRVDKHLRKRRARRVVCVNIGGAMIAYDAERMYVTEGGDLLLFQGRAMVRTFAAGVWSSAIVGTTEGDEA